MPDQRQTVLESIDNESGDGTRVIAIGASAGGLEALEAFFRNVDPETDACYIVLQHLSSDHRSMMDELLSRQTTLPVSHANDRMRIERKNVYLLPPGKEMIISDRQLLLADRDNSQQFSLPIDRFFRSLAQDIGKQAVAIILSGTGSDGSRGLVHVHDAGGLVLAQDEESARFNGMPRMAQDTGFVDATLHPEEMPAAIEQLLQRPPISSELTARDKFSYEEDGLGTIFRLLRHKYGIDFSSYKAATISRRIERRLSLCQISDLDQYAKSLTEDHDELNRLYKDLLIGVTRFFRDSEAFEYLESDVLDPLIRSKEPDDELRVWVAGCGTGEEAYSIAMIISELCEQLPYALSVKIFATDVHERSLNHAAKGVYSEESLSEISPTRLAKFFVRKDDGYHVISHLRSLLVFAPHNVIRDAPFTSMDLISCRNVLIYFRAPAQNKVISLFHFGLKLDGILWLGASESVGLLSDEFASVDDHNKVFRKRRNSSISSGQPQSLALASSAKEPVGIRTTSRTVPSELLEIYDRLLDEYMPPSVLINESREILHTFSGTQEFFSHRPGRPTNDLLDHLSDELKLPVSTTLARAFKEKTPVVFAGIRMVESNQTVKISVQPFYQRGNNRPNYLVEFAATENREPRDESERVVIDKISFDQLEEIESELKYTKESLQATIQELEATNEELQAANEELVASNEELQSTNEELHSVNEELYTVNAEHQRKIVELTEMTDDMDNLLVSTNVDTVFLDSELRIRKFTPGIAKIFNLIPQDVGRRIDNFTHNLQGQSELELLNQVLKSGEPAEREVRDHRGMWQLLRVLPYRTRQSIDGVVLTIIDVSSMKQAEAKLRELSEIVQQSEDAIFRIDLDGTIGTWNRGGKQLLGYSSEEMIGSNVLKLIPDEEEATTHKILFGVADNHVVQNKSTRWLTKENELLDIALSISPIRNENDRIVAASVIGRDNTEIKRAEDEIREALSRRDQFLAMLSHELRNPFSAILNATNLLREEKLDEATSKEARDVLEHQLQHVSRLLDDLLDVARVANGTLSVRKELVNLNELVLDVCDCIQHAIEEGQHRLYVDQQDLDVFVLGDVGRLQQAQVNLLVNACKYSPEGSRIWYSLGREGDQAVIRVRDEGDGIGADALERIFEPFVQSEQTIDRSQGGMGLGLSLVRLIAEAHGGRVDVTSSGVGEGSEFSVYLPVTYPHSVPESAPPDRLELEKLSVLLVEDNDGIRKMLGRTLQLKGLTVEMASNGNDGLKKLKDSQPDIAIIDIGLPDINGYELAKEIRSQSEYDSMTLVAVTGYGRQEDRLKAEEAGFDLHLVKPIDPNELVHVIANYRANKT